METASRKGFARVRELKVCKSSGVVKREMLSRAMIVYCYSCLTLGALIWPSTIECQENHEHAKRVEAKQQERWRRSPLTPLTELRASGSKSEPPSRPSVDWSKQRPFFGPDIQRNVSVELGKTAYLTCKVHELGDKTVSWLRPRENEILTSGKYTYIGDPRFASINDNGSQEWILEIKDVGLNDSTSYECQVSTDPKMSTTINLHVKAARARIKQGEQYYTVIGSNSIEFTCEIGQKSSTVLSSATPGGLQQTYWYFNGNLLNYARVHQLEKNFSIEWDPITQTSRFKLFNVQSSDAGNYTCKPTSAEPATIRLHVKRAKNGLKERTQHSNGYIMNSKEAHKSRNYDMPIDFADSAGSIPLLSDAFAVYLTCCLITYLLISHI